jgi:hypothetical protein
MMLNLEPSHLLQLAPFPLAHPRQVEHPQPLLLYGLVSCSSEQLVLLPFPNRTVESILFNKNIQKLVFFLRKAVR